MKRAVLLTAVLAVAFLPPADVQAEEKTTLNGSFVWEGGGADGDLEAVFMPTKTEGRWNVAFHFEFRGKPHTYEGTAEGSLTTGELSGTVKNENKRRTFKFEGSFEDGKFSGTHSEGRSRTGTLELSAPG